ncbi:MAG: GIY-YIG nuclease family protein [Pseudomonadota bacterium]
MADLREGAFVYILRCSDGAYYVGSYRGDDLNVRVAEHNFGHRKKAWTYRRRPVELVWSEHFVRYTDAVSCERQLKGWSRAKKEALIDGDYSKLRRLARSKSSRRTPSS